MNRFFAVLILMMALGVPSFAQWAGRLSADDQREFDKYYKKWVDDTRRNDRDDIASDVRHMQDIMVRNNVPSDVPFDRVASTGGGDYAGSGSGYAPARLSAEDQAEFDRYYTRWVDDSRRNDRDDIESDVRHMQDIMSRYNIPSDVPYDRIASQGYQGGSDQDRSYSAPPPPQWRGRLAASDQSDFDKWYAKWVDDTRKNDRDDIARDEGKMQEIMARNNIPSTVHFAEIASNSDAGPYPGESAGAAYEGYRRWQGRLSAHDQKEFDEAYAKWVKDQDKNDRDDIPKDVHKMQEIMGHNGIPSDVPYEQIASPGVAIRR